VRAGSFFLGIVVVALGLLLLFFGTQTQTIDVPRTETKVLFDRLMFTVGDSSYRSADMTANLTVLCSGSVKIPANNESGDINLYVMDRANFQKWESGDRSVNFVVQRLRISQINVSFVTLRDDTYYFVFDNSYSPLFKKEVTFSVSYQYITIHHETLEDRSLNIYGYPLILIGAIITVYGLARKAEVRWA
jgi:uncharacterized membrane protein